MVYRGRLAVENKNARAASWKYSSQVKKELGKKWVRGIRRYKRPVTKKECTYEVQSVGIQSIIMSLLCMVTDDNQT